MRAMKNVLFAFVIFGLLATTSLGQEWANFKARFVYDGKVPERKVLEVSKNEKLAAGLSADHKILDESLIVDEKTKGIANILIWVIPDSDKPDAKMPIHSSYDMPPPEHVIRIKNFAYFPHVSIMRTGTKKLVFLGDDRVAHNANVDSPEILPFGRSIPANMRDEWPIKSQMRVPAPIRCNIHPHEKAYVLVRDNPYFAVTDEKGEFEIKNLPMGEWRFKVWHEKAGYLTDVKLGKSVQKWPKGEFKIKVEKIDFYLGDITVPAKAFEK